MKNESIKNKKVSCIVFILITGPLIGLLANFITTHRFDFEYSVSWVSNSIPLTIVHSIPTTRI
jgi:hypothetical protein